MRPSPGGPLLRTPPTLSPAPQHPLANRASTAGPGPGCQVLAWASGPGTPPGRENRLRIDGSAPRTCGLPSLLPTPVVPGPTQMLWSTWIFPFPKSRKERMDRTALDAIRGDRQGRLTPPSPKSLHPLPRSFFPHPLPSSFLLASFPSFPLFFNCVH